MFWHSDNPVGRKVLYLIAPPVHLVVVAPVTAPVTPAIAIVAKTPKAT